MHQKDAIKEAWRAAGLYESRDAKLQEFLHRLDAAPFECWPEFVDEVRRNYPEYKRQVVEPIVNSGDKILRLSLIRNADFTKRDEAAIAARFVARADPVKDQAELKALLLHGSPEIVGSIRKLKNLPRDLKAMIEPPAPPVPESPKGASGRAKASASRLRRKSPTP